MFDNFEHDQQVVARIGLLGQFRGKRFRFELGADFGSKEDSIRRWVKWFVPGKVNSGIPAQIDCTRFLL